MGAEVAVKELEQLPDCPSLANGEFTFEKEDGGRRTVRIKTQALDSKWNPGRRVVSMLTGKDNTEFGDWTSVGLLEPDGSLSVFKKQQGGKLEAICTWAVKVLLAPAEVRPKTVRIHESTRCIRCNRLLTVPSSILNSLGPDCAEKIAWR